MDNKVNLIGDRRYNRSAFQHFSYEKYCLIIFFMSKLCVIDVFQFSVENLVQLQHSNAFAFGVIRNALKPHCVQTMRFVGEM